MNTSVREQKGIEIANMNLIKKIDDHTYKVKSQTSNQEYDVISLESGWVCSCPDSMYRNVKCKHVFALEVSISIKKQVQAKTPVIIEPISTSNCIYCKSDRIVKDGLRHNKYGDIQKFNCKECKKYFTINIGFEKMKHDPKGITTAMQLYFSGESLRNTAKSLKLLGMDVSHKTVYNWIKKYTGIMQDYSEKLKPQVSDTWRADEMYLKIRGNMKYLYAMMDDQTRFFIAQEVANTKYTHDVQKLFKEATRITERKPKTFITDGAFNYKTAFYKEYRTRAVKDRPVHIRHIRFWGDNNNNKMERLNGEIRDREKTMRGIKKMDTPILKGYQIYHNYFRTHEGLDGKTPAQACGIEIQGDNKWKTFIENASRREA
ncbi:MAG: IS6 family transposase [Thaumarchaeota archaeon]|nr:IS6 family transposase [Nitrososphaerota archaeon]MDE1818425.1 IS6 family transposase [Nitrososphaerota archaeon]